MNEQSLRAVAAPGGASLVARYRACRARTEALLAGLSPEDCQAQSMPDASPVRWHLAHTTWFLETFLLPHAEAGFRPYREAWLPRFNSYYLAVGDPFPRAGRGLLTRPTLDEVRDWRRDVDARVMRVLPGLPGHLAPIVEIGLAHEEQHQELLLTDLKHLLSLDPEPRAYRPEAPGAIRTDPLPLRWIAHGEGVRSIGHDGADFAFDNEGPRHRVFLEAFELAARPATNAEWLSFVREGGYRTPSLWLSEGWRAATAEGWRAPLHWRERDGVWHEFTLRGLEPLDPAAPVVHVSYFEADAFAR